MKIISNNDILSHYGIKGQKWGVRNYENYDGTLTEEGKARYYGSVGGVASNKKYRIGDVRRSAKNTESSKASKRAVASINNLPVGTPLAIFGLTTTLKNSKKFLGEKKYNIVKEGVKFALMGKVGTESYNAARSLGANRLQAYGEALQNYYANIFTLGKTGSKIANKYGFKE